MANHDTTMNYVFSPSARRMVLKLTSILVSFLKALLSSLTLRPAGITSRYLGINQQLKARVFDCLWTDCVLSICARSGAEASLVSGKNLRSAATYCPVPFFGLGRLGFSSSSDGTVPSWSRIGCSFGPSGVAASFDRQYGGSSNPLRSHQRAQVALVRNNDSATPHIRSAPASISWPNSCIHLVSSGSKGIRCGGLMLQVSIDPTNSCWSTEANSSTRMRSLAVSSNPTWPGTRTFLAISSRLKEFAPKQGGKTMPP